MRHIRVGQSLVKKIIQKSSVIFQVNLQTEKQLLRSPFYASIGRKQKKHLTFSKVADYFCWSVQWVFEMGETRFYDYLQDKISWVINLYDIDKYKGNRHYYTTKNPLTDQNKLSPPLP